jgi:hypothetical protein
MLDLPGERVESLNTRRILIAVHHGVDVDGPRNLSKPLTTK